jgi:uncharacterized membrane protein (DUF2068 family)
MRNLHLNLHLTHFSKSKIADVLFVVTVTFGVISLVGGLSLVLFTASLPAKVSGVDAATRSVVFVMSQIPGIPLELGDLIKGGGLTLVGIALWVLGFDSLLIGLGLWARSKFAKWIALVVFSAAAFFDFVQFLFLGLFGSPSSVVGLFVNGTIVYLLTKLDF